MTPMHYCATPFFYRRRQTREVVVGDPAKGGVIIGGDHPIVVQSMLTCDTMDTAPTVKDAANLKNIVTELRARGCLVPIVADIHFKPEAALESARWVEMVR